MLDNDTTDSIYILNDGSAQTEHERLNRQHVLFMEILENDLLPPHIKSSLAASTQPPKVLDLATGTGIWLLSVAKELPSDAELVGLDFDTTKFPPPAELPNNVSLRKANMFEPFPDELLGTFDVVNVRLIIFALKAGDGLDLVKNIMTLLKPGGWVVWTETGPLVTVIEPPSLAWYKFQDVNYRFAKRVGRDLNLPIGMVKYIKDAGCEECGDKAYAGHSQFYTQNAKDWVERTNTHFDTFIPQTLRGIVSLGGVEGMTTQKDVDALVAEANRDFGGRDRKIQYLFMRAWGRKPGAPAS
ncbi:hypothetical protein F5Y16DRAFT_374048 [Xylariaceae sp. FL0255]|nr:hypothetical protein F5Y16DRAFT_374048 [Xylariaceae sp. FL0255]